MIPLKRCSKCRQVLPGQIPELTPRQLQVVQAIAEFRSLYGYMPTFDELGQVMGLGKLTVYEHVHKLAIKGVIRLQRHRARGIELLWKPVSAK